jgi:hypothetical protein
VSTIHLIGGEKGGVGKSVLARILCQYCIDGGLPFAALDADRSHGALLRSYAEYTRACDLESFSSADQIIDRALGAERQVIVDLPAQIAQSLTKWLEGSDVLNFAEELGIKLAFWHVTDGGYDSVNLLESMVGLQGSGDERGNSVVVVKNYGRSDFFAQVDESSAWKRLQARGGHLVELPALDASTMYSIDRSGLSLWAAINESQGGLTPMERRRAALWLQACYDRLDNLNSVF